jgi:hypothetical protein
MASPPPDPLTNPYAPPAAEIAPAEAPRSSSRSDYTNERRSVLLLILLSVVTFGIYPTVWYVRRARFLDSLASDKKVGVIPWFLVVADVALVAVAIAHAPEGAIKAVQLATGITSLVLAFRVAHILRSDFARSGRLIGVSGAGVFFFGCLYLQHVMNEAAATPARPRKRRKKEKPPSAEDHDDDAALRPRSVELAEEDVLPRPEGEPPILHRD